MTVREFLKHYAFINHAGHFCSCACNLSYISQNTTDLYGIGVLYTTVNNCLQKRKDPPRGRIQGKDPPRHGGRPRSTKLLTLPDDKEVSSLPSQPKTQFPLDMVSF